MIDVPILLAAVAAVALGSILQAASGVGAGFIMVPMLAWLDLSLVPGPMIFGSLALSGVMTWQERGDIDRNNLPIIVTAMLPGAVLGGWVLSSVPAASLGLVFGVVILIALGITVAGPDLPLNRLTAAVSGIIAGVMGGSTGVGAPILAILYQHESGPRVRSTLALLYTIASAMIVIVLAAFGKFGAAEALAGTALIPGFLAGFFIANRFRGHLDQRGTRPLVLATSGIAAVALILRSLVA